MQKARSWDQNPGRTVAALPHKTNVLLLPSLCIAGLAAFTLVPRIGGHQALLASFGAASAVLAVWLAILWIQTRRTGRRLAVEVSVRPQHYLQAIAHTSIFVYWGLYWMPIRDAAPLIAAQIVFAYAFDMLLSWSRRDSFTLGFGPFPIIFSTNLFLRFHDDWFYLQFLMVAVGFLAKELIRWNRDGRRSHIFNPSSFPLALFSLALIATGTTDITWGEQIATLLTLPPQMYLFIFLVALPGQFLFRVTTMTLPAVLTTYLFSVAYLKLTGTYFFFDSNVPIAVFLGMHLLFTDPSTSPRTELGRILFGVFYGLTVVALYAVLDWAGAPTFYDKLLQVPLMNLMVMRFDAVAQWAGLAWINPERLGRALAPRLRSLAYVSLWIVVFGAMSAANGIGDHHPGHTIPFWESACREGRRKACDNLAQIERRYCSGGSGWACNELGILGLDNRATTEPPAGLFERACTAGFRVACENKTALQSASRSVKHGDPSLSDYLWVLQEGRGPLKDQRPFEVYTRACNQGWVAGCGSLGDFYFQGGDRARGVALWQRACGDGHANSCSNLGVMNRLGDGVPKDNGKAAAYLQQACGLGLEKACRLLAELKAEGY